jgi:hypothetical protein
MPLQSKGASTGSGAARRIALVWMGAALFLGLTFAALWAMWFLKGAHPALVGLLVFTPLAGLWALYRALQQPGSIEVSATERARNRTGQQRILFAAFVYFAIIYVSQWALWLLDGRHPAIISLVALTPMIGLLLMLRAIVQAHRESDELQRRIDGEAAVIAACVVGLGSFALGLVLAALRDRMHMVPAMHIGPLLIAVWGIAKWRLSRRYA